MYTIGSTMWNLSRDLGDLMRNVSDDYEFKTVSIGREKIIECKVYHQVFFILYT